MDLTASDVRDVRFGTTRLRAGYNMAEVDAFLDQVEKTIATYAESYQRAKDDADALRSQVQQVQNRLEALQAERQPAEAPTLDRPEDKSEDVVAESADLESTAENPIVATSPAGTEDSSALAELRRVRDEVRAVLREQLELVDSLDVPDPQAGASTQFTAASPAE